MGEYTLLETINATERFLVGMRVGEAVLQSIGLVATFDDRHLSYRRAVAEYPELIIRYRPVLVPHGI